MSYPRWLIALCVGVVFVATPATYADLIEDIDLTLTAPSATANFVDATLEVDIILGPLPEDVFTASDEQSGAMTGNMLVQLEIDFNELTHQVEDVTAIEFTGGRTQMNNATFRLDYLQLGGAVVAVSAGIQGVFSSLEHPSEMILPPALPGQPFEFFASDHLLMFDQGAFNAVGEGAFSTVTASVVLDSGANSLDSISGRFGTIAVSLAKVTGTKATYNATIRLPVDFSDPAALNEDQMKARILGTGMIEATGQFFRTVPGPDTLTWVGPASGDWNSISWDGGNPGDVPNAEVRAEVPANLVALTADGSTHSLLIDGVDAGVEIGPGATLTVAQDVEVTQGSLRIAATGILDMAAGAVFAADSQLVIALSGSDAGQIRAGDTVRLETGSSLRFEVTGKDRFVAGQRILISKTAGEDGVVGSFTTIEGLGQYVTDTGLSNVDGSLVLTIDKSLNPGDADLNTITDVRDFNVWNTNKFTSGTDWATGDFDGNGTTDVRDFNAWNTAKFTSAPAAAPMAAGQVPEPATLVLFVCGLIGLMGLRRRHQ